MPRPAQTPPDESRSRTMRAIRATGNAPETALVAALGRIGLEPDFRNDRALPGSPDFVFCSAALVVFVDGAFWHGKARSLPKTNADWWAAKLKANARRDRRDAAALARAGWTVKRLDAGFCKRYPDAAAMSVAFETRRTRRP